MFNCLIALFYVYLCEPVWVKIYALSELNCVYNFSIDVAADVAVAVVTVSNTECCWLYEYRKKAGPLIRFNFENVWLNNNNGNGGEWGTNANMQQLGNAKRDWSQEQLICQTLRRHLSYLSSDPRNSNSSNICMSNSSNMVCRSSNIVSKSH